MMRPSLIVYLSLVVMFGLASPVRAQQWAGALKLGGTVTTFVGDTASGTVDWKSRAGLAGGVTIGYDLGNGFIPQFDLLYVRKGASGNTVLDDGTPLAIRSDITYLEVPLLIAYRLEMRGRIHPKIVAGPMLALRLDARISSRVRGTTLEQTELDESIEKRDFGVVAGAGIDVDMGGQRVAFEVRAALGKADITKPDRDGNNPKLNVQGIEFMVGILF